MNPVTDYGPVSRFERLESLPDGRFTISSNGVPIDFAYRSAGAETTVVCFHGAALATVSLPWHVGQGVMEGLDANWLAVSDPALAIDAQLPLAWYAGTKELPNLQAYMSRIVKHVLNITGTKNVVFFGGSGGGFAALDMSRRHPGSLALVMNPQTSIANYKQLAIDLYLQYAWPGLARLSQLPGSVKHNQIKEYLKSMPNTVAYIQNARDYRHIERHMTPFFEAVGDSPNVWLHMDAWGERAGTGHVPPPREVVAAILFSLVSAKGNWAEGLHRSDFANRVDLDELIPAIKNMNRRYVHDVSRLVPTLTKSN